MSRCKDNIEKHLKEIGYADANMVYSRAERVFVREHYFASKSFAAVRGALNNAYPDNEVLNKTALHRLVTTFRDTEVFVCDKCSLSDRTVETTVVQI
jgi:hypothetical protein